MITVIGAILFVKNSLDTAGRLQGKPEPYIATGGIQPEYFLGGILFIIMIMILILIIKITNIKQKNVT